MDMIKSFIEGIINVYLNNPMLLLETSVLIVLYISLEDLWESFG